MEENEPGDDADAPVHQHWWRDFLYGVQRGGAKGRADEAQEDEDDEDGDYIYRPDRLETPGACRANAHACTSAQNTLARHVHGFASARHRLMLVRVCTWTIDEDPQVLTCASTKDG